MKAFMLMKWVSDDNLAIRLTISRLALPLSHKKEEEVVKRAYEVMNILRSGLSETSNILGPTPKPIARTHNLYHYQILIKYRLEDELGPTLNQVLALTSTNGKIVSSVSALTMSHSNFYKKEKI